MGKGNRRESKERRGGINRHKNRYPRQMGTKDSRIREGEGEGNEWVCYTYYGQK